MTIDIRRVWLLNIARFGVVAQLCIFQLGCSTPSTPSYANPARYTGTTYRVTEGLYSEKADWAAAVRTEFGDGAAVADWRDLKRDFGRDRAALLAMLDAAGVARGEGAALKTEGAQRYGAERGYFFVRHEGPAPGNWLVHDSLHRGVMNLGSWPGSRRILTQVPVQPGTVSHASTTYDDMGRHPSHAAETGYVVGRVYLKIDGFQNTNRDIIERMDVQLAYVKDNKLSLVKTTTDSHGYFAIGNQPLDGRYFPYQIQGEGKAPISSLVPDPDPSKGIGGMLYFMFSSGRETGPPIIDCGETIILVKPDGKLAVERSYNKNKSILDSTQKNPFASEEGVFGYPGLLYYAHSGSGTLRATAREALHDRQAFARAEPLKKEGDDLRSRDKGAAVSKYQQAIKAYSAYADAYIALARLLNEMNRNKDAIAFLEIAHKACPQSDAVTFELGKLYVATDQAPRAISLLEAYIQKKADDLSVYDNLAKAYVAAGRKSYADRLWQRAISAVQSENRFRQAADYYRGHGEFGKAIPLYEQFLAAKPKDRWAYGYLADSLRAAGRLVDGVQLWERGLREIDDEGKFHGAGQFFSNADMLDRAIVCYEQYLKLKPTDRWRFTYLADAYLAANRYEDGDTLWQRGLREIDDDIKYLGAAQFYRKAGKHDKALPLFEAYAKAKPDDDWAAAYLAQAHFLNRDPKKAEHVMSQNGKAVTFYRCAGTAAEAKRYDWAERWTRMAFAKYADGTLDKSKEDIERAAARNKWKHDLEKQWVAYLKTIQEEGDYGNWEKKPYDWYVQEHPLGVR